MTDLGPAISGSNAPGLSHHDIELAPGDSAPKYPMQSTPAPAAAARVPTISNTPITAETVIRSLL